jgi:hypothetical protein
MPWSPSQKHTAHQPLQCGSHNSKATQNVTWKPIRPTTKKHNPDLIVAHAAQCQKQCLRGRKTLKSGSVKNAQKHAQRNEQQRQEQDQDLCQGAREGAGSWPSKTTRLTAGTFSPVQNYQCLHSLGSQAAHVSSLIPGPA